jgi:hypothetical protein
MAVYSPGANNISAFNLANTTGVTGTSNISFAALLAILPNQGAPHALSEVQSDGIVYGTIASNTGGEIAIAGAYTGTVSPNSSAAITEFNGSDTSVTLTANAVYPWTFLRWTDQNGTQISTSNPITLNAANFTSATTIRAEYSTTHVTP